MKYLVETLGEYGLHDLFGQQQVAANRPSVVRNSPFIEAQRGIKLRIIEELADEADDAPLAEAASPEDLEAAIAALPRPGDDKAAKAPAKARQGK